jgi:uncharacterized SAM-binding protein YcdF (DUF218 family)
MVKYNLRYTTVKWLFLIAGVIFLFYFLAIAFFMPHGTGFYFIWLAAAGFSFILYWLFGREKSFWGFLPGWVRTTLIVLAAIGLLVFVFVEGCIVSRFWDQAPADLDYIIVLGAQMKESGPSRALQMRLDRAYDYLTANERTKAVLSGGQGPDEPVSEAQGMRDYLVSRGIKEDRLILEEKSTSTWENLTFSSRYVEAGTDTVGIVTNNFHIFRAKKIAEKAGYQNIYGIAAKGEAALQLNNMIREFFGVVKDFLVGNL